MPHDLIIPVDPQQTVVARVARVFGSGYATLLLEHDGDLVEVPVQLGSALVHQRYATYWRRLMQEWVQPGDGITVQLTGARTGGSLDVVEVLDESGMPLSLYAIRQGWGIPQREVLDTIGHQLPYLYALQDARTHARGIWHASVPADDLVEYLSVAVLDRTAPEVTSSSMVSVLSTVMVLLAIVWAACATAQRRSVPAARGGVTAPVRWMWRQWSPFVARLAPGRQLAADLPVQDGQAAADDVGPDTTVADDQADDADVPIQEKERT